MCLEVITQKKTNKQTKITDCMSPMGLCTLLGLGPGLNSIKYLM